VQNSALDLDFMLQNNMQVLKQRGRDKDARAGIARVKNRRQIGAERLQSSLYMPDLWQKYLFYLDPEFLDPLDKDASLRISQNRVEKGKV
jgi:hypothetical protein